MVQVNKKLILFGGLCCQVDKVPLFRQLLTFWLKICKQRPLKIFAKCQLECLNYCRNVHYIASTLESSKIPTFNLAWSLIKLYSLKIG